MQHGDGGDVYILQREVMMRDQGNTVICLYTSTEQFHCQGDKALSFIIIIFNVNQIVSIAGLLPPSFCLSLLVLGLF